MKHKEIAQKWNMSIEMVQGINTGRYYFQDNVEYPLQKSIYNKPDRFEKKYCVDCGKEIDKRSIRCKKCNDIYIGKLARANKLSRPTKEELLKLLEEHSGNFTLIGRIYGVTDNTIRKWCLKYNLPIHTSDYKMPPKKVEKSTKKRPVYQLDQNKNILGFYSSASEAGRSIGVNNSAHITDVCQGKRKTTYGYYWRYAETI